MKLAFFIAAAVSGLVPAAWSDCSIRLESHAFGSGTFGYELTIQRNAFLARIYDVTFQVAPFEGYVGATASDGGGVPISETSLVYATWSGDWPETATRLVTAWSTANNTCVTNALILFLAEVAGWSSSPYLSGNIAGYVKLPALAPAVAPDPAAGTTLATNTVIVPDPRLVDITPQTISFAWPTSATLRIEAAWHTGEWTRVTNVFYDPPVTTWTSSLPLAEVGERFRVVLLAASHDTNLLAASSAPAADAPIERIVPAGGGVNVTLKTAPGRRYGVGLYDTEGRALDTAIVRADSDRLAVTLRDGGARTPVLVRAQRLVE